MARCRHHYLQIEEFNDLGMVVSCPECNATFQLGDAAAASDFLDFVHTIPGKGEREVCFLIHHSRVKLP